MIPPRKKKKNLLQFYELNVVENSNGFWQWGDKQENDVINANNSQVTF